MEDILKIFTKITNKVDECDALVTISDVSDGLKHTLTMLEEESHAIKELKKSNEPMYAAAQIEFICSFLASMYVNAIAKSPEEAKELMKEFMPDKVIKVNRKADA